MFIKFSTYINALMGHFYCTDTWLNLYNTIQKYKSNVHAYSLVGGLPKLGCII